MHGSGGRIEVAGVLRYRYFSRKRRCLQRAVVEQRLEYSYSTEELVGED